MQNKVSYIVDAKRSPIGKKDRSLSNLPLLDIAAKTIQGFQGIDIKEVDSLIVGTVIQTGLGSNIARQILLSTGMPVQSTAQTVNMVCGSGLYAIHLADSKLKLGEANLMIAGGAESMSRAPFFGKEGKSTLLSDALLDPVSQDHMGITAENVAEKYDISRNDQDEFAFLSHQRATEAWDFGYFDNEIVPIKTDEGSFFSRDECVRSDSSLESLSRLKTVFKEKGTVTAGNASPISDGASFLLLSNNKNYGDPIAEIIDYCEVGFDPELMGYAPFFAIEKLLKKNNLSVNDIDLFEINEAFASQCVAVSRDLKIPIDKLNISGGAIAIGHPLGASGARIVTTLVHNLKRKNLEYGIASLCIGGGMACAMLIKNC